MPDLSSPGGPAYAEIAHLTPRSAPLEAASLALLVWGALTYVCFFSTPASKGRLVWNGPGLPSGRVSLATDESREPERAWKCEACIMTLSSALIHKTVRYPCPVCSYELSRSGSWFRSVSSFTCESRGSRMRIPYSAKLSSSRHWTEAPANLTSSRRLCEAPLHHADRRLLRAEGHPRVEGEAAKLHGPEPVQAAWTRSRS